MGSNLAFSHSTSERYALALYELAKEQSVLLKIETEATGLKNLLVSSLDFKNMIISPIVGKNEQAKVIIKIAENNKFSAVFTKFLGFLAFKGRLFFLGKILDSFLNLVSSSKGELKVNLSSSKELLKQEIELIQQDLSKHFGSDIKINYKFDPNLLAGLVIQIGSIMIDASVKNQLKRLEKIMIEA